MRARVHGVDSLRSEMEDFVEQTGGILRDEILRTARSLAVSLATSTQPYGLGRDAQSRGRMAVQRDIGHVFASPSQFYQMLRAEDPDSATPFWKAWKTRDRKEMEEIARKSRVGSGMEVLSAPSPTMHQMRRNNRGRVAGKRPSALVTDAQAMRAYVREVQGRVGTAKDGWADAAADCGGTQGLPAWASTRHAERHGGADVRETDAGPVVTLRNEVPWIRQVLPEGEEQTAVGIAEERLMKRMETILRKQD